MTRTLYNNHPDNDYIKNHPVCLFKYTYDALYRLQQRACDLIEELVHLNNKVNTLNTPRTHRTEYNKKLLITKELVQLNTKINTLNTLRTHYTNWNKRAHDLTEKLVHLGCV
jgi:predicted RNase H-like nuclease (RuvC/YqgF family)